jgi:PAS domain S-box-containing protein
VPAIESYWIDIYAGVASSGQSIRFENRALALDHRWYAVYAFRIDDPALRRVAILFNDITEKKHAEAALRISEARLENALTIAALGTFEWNLRTQTIVLSERGRQIFGFAPHETPSAAEIIARIQPNDYSRVLAQATKGLTGGGRRTVEYRVLLPDGTVRHVKSVSDVAPDDEEPQRFVGVLEDITAARLAAQRLAQMNDTLERRVKTRTRALRRSENRFRAYFDASPEYLYLLRLNPEDQWVIEDANPAGAALYGLSREALIGQMLADLDHPDDVKRLDAQVRRVLNSGITGSFESRRLVNGSWIVINTTVAPVNPADGLNLVLVSSRDLTGQRQAEDALRQSQKMEAIGQLTGGIAHDFNNLLAGVMGSLELMQKRIMQGRVNDLDRYIASAREASTRAAGLTHRLLAFSRRQTLSPILTDVNRLVKSMEELIRRTIGPEVELDVAATENLWMTQVDPNQLENALLNLCINSRDAMPSGGRVTIETANFEVDDRMAREGNLLVGQYVSLSVTDTGVGMTPEVAMRAYLFGVGPRRHGVAVPAAKRRRRRIGLKFRREVDASARCGGADRIGRRRRGDSADAHPRGAARLGIRSARSRRWSGGVGDPAFRFSHRFTGDRCGAARHEWSAACRCGPCFAPRAESPVHHRVCRERGDQSRTSGGRHADHDQALHDGGAQQQGPGPT